MGAMTIPRTWFIRNPYQSKDYW